MYCLGMASVEQQLEPGSDLSNVVCIRCRSGVGSPLHNLKCIGCRGFPVHVVSDGHCYIRRGWALLLDERGDMVVQDMDLSCSVSCPSRTVKMGYELTKEE